MKNWKIVSIVSAILLVGLLLPGCFTARIDELEAQKADLEGQVAVKDARIAELEEDLEDRDSQIVELEDQAAELEVALAKIPQDPSYDELMTFLRQDCTERGWYQSHATYTQLFLERAKKKGIRGYPVAVLLITNRILMFAGFETTDKGWIYILPAIDRKVELEKGKSYRQLNGSSPFGHGDDTIVEIMIFD